MFHHLLRVGGPPGFDHRVDEVCRQAGRDALSLLQALSRGGNKKEEYDDTERARFHRLTPRKGVLPSI